MALSLELLQSPDGSDLVRGLKEWRKSLLELLARFPLLDPRGVYKPNVAIKGSGTRVEPGFQPRTWFAFRVRSSVVTAIVETTVDSRGVTLASGTDCIADLWLVP